MPERPPAATSGRSAPLLLLVGSGDRRYREYILAAVSRHVRLWLLDAQPVTWQAPYLAGSTVTDTRDPAALTEAARAVRRRQPVAGAFSYDEALVHATAHLTRDLGLPGSPPEAVLACRDKAATRAALAAAGIPQPRSVPVGDAVQAQAAADRIGYPVVVKARGLAGSLGVVFAPDRAAVTGAFRAAAGARWPGVPRYTADVLIEEYLDGPEISVDAVLRGGVCTPYAVARKHTGLTPYFEETGHTVHGADPLLHDAELLDQLTRLHKALGLTDGATHSEFRLTAHGPRLVEVNARLGGDFIPYLGLLATGRDPAVAAAYAAAGLPLPAPPGPVRPRTAAIRFLYPEADCQAVEALVHPGRLGPTVHRAVATAAPGTRLALPPRGYLARYGYAIAVGDDPGQVAADLDRVHEAVELRAEPLS
jgi:biotin carboxylase